MEIRKRSVVAFVAALALVMALSGCAGSVKHMRPVSPDQVVTRPDPGKSMVVFMRPSGIGFAIQSSVFEVRDETSSLMGIVAAKKKVACQMQPGEHLFMVIGESADFMSADLEAGKTYYALVTPRIGVWKARFSLKPVHADELQSEKFQEWLNGCEWVEKTPDSDQWAASNMSSIQSKRVKYYEKWMSKDASERPRLLPQDGQ
jgi:hypothetical protein